MIMSSPLLFSALPPHCDVSRKVTLNLLNVAAGFDLSYINHVETFIRIVSFTKQTHGLQQGHHEDVAV